MKDQLKIWAPVVAVALLALGYLWFALLRGGAPTEAPGKLPARVASESAPAALEPRDASAPSTAWPTYHGGSALTGAVDTMLPDQSSRLWRYQTSAPVLNTPVAGDGRIYFATAKGTVHALDVAGNEVWTQRFTREPAPDGAERMEKFEAPVACFDSLVLAGSESGALYALDAATGDLRWTYDVGDTILGTAVREAGRIYIIGQNEGTLHCVALETGERIWRGGGVERCDGSPSLADGAIVFGSCAAALHVFSATDGATLRTIPLGDDAQIAAGVALAGDSAFAGSHGGQLVHAAWKTGEVVWLNEDSEDEILATPAVNDDWVVFASQDGHVYGLERATGKQKWKYDTGGAPRSPVIAGDKVVVCANGVLLFLRLQTGEKVWSHDVSDEITSPAIAGAMVVVGGDDGAVTAFGAS